MRPFALFFALMLASCGSGSPVSGLKAPALSAAEGREDMDALASSVRRLYGPLRLKEERFQLKLDDLVRDAAAGIDGAGSDADTYAALVGFLGRFEDGHVSIAFPGNATGVKSYKIDAFLAPAQGHALVAQVGPTLAAFGIAPGDELVSVDGQKPYDLLPTFKKYAWYANEVSDEHLIYKALNRPFFIKELVPTAPTAHLVFLRADGTTYDANPVWTKVRYATDDADLVTAPAPGRGDLRFSVPNTAELNDAARGTLLGFGKREPFFLSKATRAQTGLVVVEPNEEALSKWGVKRAQLVDKDGFAVFAALYRHAGKTVLLVRIPSYDSTLETDDLLKGYKALLEQYEGLADVLVLDQTHNPGGKIFYATNLLAVFLKAPARNMVEHVHADRRWVATFKEWAGSDDSAQAQGWRNQAALVDQALDQGRELTAPMPLVGTETLAPAGDYHWKKPLLLLADELSGSCGDIVPMLVKANGVAKIFGRRTMGLGGNVEEVVTLPNSQAKVNLTRGLFTTYRPEGGYGPGDLVENVGVEPDYPYALAASDYRDGFAAYVKAFSDAAVAQLP